jgi:SpoVK/Ycf46/Vps4 family AAA+-type ATPase
MLNHNKMIDDRDLITAFIRQRQQMQNQPEKTRKKNSLSVNEITMDLGDLELDDIVGQDKAIEELKLFAESIEYNLVYKAWNTKPPKGILLSGPPGVGKTAAVKALGKRLEDKVSLVELRYVDIASKWVDAPIESLREFFQIVENEATRRHVIVFIDEIDAMLPNRDNNIHETSARRVNVFLDWLSGGYRQLENITLIGATNYLEGVDKAARRAGRFDKLIEFKPLTVEACVDGLKIHLKKRNLNDLQLGIINWDKVETALRENAYKNINGADLPEIINRVVARKIKEQVGLLEEAGFSMASEEKKLEMLQSPLYIPKPISTQDIVEAIYDYERESDKKSSGSTMGFSLEASV